MANVTTEDKDTSKNETVTVLCRKLREGELRESFDSVSTTMHGVTTSSSCRLGPSLTAEVQIEGCPVSALLDTGSPATIASLEFLLDVWAKQKSDKVTVKEWKEAIQRRMEEPKLALQNYGGEILNILCQTKVRLERAGYFSDTIVQVHKGAPVHLLLGTNLLPVLGFRLLELHPVAQKVVLPCQPEEREKTMEVRLLQATRLPAKHKKLVKAHAPGSKLMPFFCLKTLFRKET